MKKLGAILLTLALVIGLSIPMAIPAAASPGPGLVGMWHFDGDSNDSSGNGNHGTIYGATYVSGNFDQALSFDGTDDYVQLPASNTILNTDTFTVEAWFKTSTNHPAYGGTEGRIVNLHRMGTASTAVSLYVEQDKIGLLYYTGTAHVWVKYTVDYHDDVWHHIAVTHDATTYRLYYDGVEVASQADAFGDFGTYPAYFGTYNSSERFFDGLIDEVRIWDTATPSFNLEATPDEDINPIDTDHTITATVTIDKVSDGTEPAPGVLVDFAASGMNADTDSDYTDSSGQVTFTYTGAGGAGMDTITAEIDQDCYQYASVDVTKYWVDRFVSGGGQLIEETDGKRKDWLVISFGGAVGDAGTSGLVGEWEVNFHNVNADGFDRTKFHTTSILIMNFYQSPCGIAMNFTAIGEWQGTPGYRMIFRAQDAGEPGSLDNVRIELFNPGGTKVYDTDWTEEFTRESNCFGTHRTYLDHGNLQMDVLP